MGNTGDWIDNIENKELQKLPNEDIQLYKIPDHIDKKITGIIRNSKKAGQEKKGIVDKRRFPIILKYAFAALSLSLLIVFGYFIYNRIIYPSYIIEENILVKTIMKTGNAILLMDSHKKELKNGDVIQKGNSIKTNENSQCAIQFSEYATALLQENSEMQCIQMDRKKNVHIKVFLKNGISLFNIKKLSGKSSFIVLTDDIDIQVKGTQFSVQVNPDKSTIIAVKKGMIELSSTYLENKVYVTEDIRIVFKDKNITYLKLTDDMIDSFNELLNLENIKSDDKIIPEDDILGNLNELQDVEDEKSDEKIIPEDDILDNVNELQDVEDEKSDEKLIPEDDILDNFNESQDVENEKSDEKPKTDSNKIETIDKTKDKNKPPLSIAITSPNNQYCIGDPSLHYEAAGCEKVIVELNGTVLSVKNGEKLRNCINGYNTLKVTALYKKKKVSSDTTFFVNKLKLAGTDDFNRPDSTYIGGLFMQEYNSPGNDMMFIHNNQLVCKGSNDGGDWSNLGETYNNKQIIQEIELVDMGPMTKPDAFHFMFWSYGIPDSQYDSIVQTIIVLEPNGFYKLYLEEFNIGTGLPHALVVPTSLFSINFITPITFIFYKNENNYHALLVDNNRYIINKIGIENYQHQLNKTFSFFGIQFMPQDTRNSREIQMIVDNYRYYQ